MTGCLSPVLAQRELRLPLRNQVVRPRPQAPQPPTEEPVVLLGPTAPIANLFDRAAEGIARQDWKFTLDCLQRIIDDPEGSMMPQPEAQGRGAAFESARRRALRQLASLPPEALQVYRLIQDGRARRLLEKGLQSRDSAALYAVADRFLLTDSGADAADHLASWALDAGRPAEAVRLLIDLNSLADRRTVSKELALGKLAAAYALLGRQKDALRTLNELTQGATADAATVWTSRREPIAALHRPGDPPSSAAANWPVEGGSNERTGHMAAVEPSLLEPLPWITSLPGTDADSWRRVLRGGTIGALTLPVGQLVGRDGRLFARTPDGVIALDDEDLDVLWEADVLPPEDTMRSAIARPRQATEESGDSGVSFDDYVAGGVSLSEDLVLTISHRGESRYILRRRDSVNRGWLTWAALPGLGGRQATGSRLIALDQQTGGVRWERGRTGDPDDPLGGVFFHAVPLDVDGKLWTPYSHEGDLSLAVLDSQDGALLRTIPLLSAGREAWGPRQALLPAAADGLIFVPVDGDLLFAVNTSDGSIRWANQFNAGILRQYETRNATATGFLPTPPIVADGLVLYAPPGADELLAFDLLNGEVVWTSRAPGAAHAIAADGGRVYLGGRTVSCRSLADGAVLWHLPLSVAPSGRAVLSGSMIHVPTLDGLLTLDAETGTELRTSALPASQDSLGNLLCMNDSLYTIHSSSVRRYIDLERSYGKTVTAFENGSADPQTTVRLAWLEIWRGAPQRAYEVLQSLPPEPQARDGRRSAPAAPARVEALLAMAGQSGGERSGEEVLALLEEASAAALTSSDRLRCQLALADQLTALGRPVEAYQRLWTMGLTADGDEWVKGEQSVHQRVRARISNHLIAIADRLSAEERVGIEAASLPPDGDRLMSLEGTEALEARVRLRAVADLSPSGVVGQRALLLLGMLHAAQGRWAQAEQSLWDSFRRDQDPTLSVAALVRLVQLHADMNQSGFGGNAELKHALKMLEDGFGGTPTAPALALLHQSDPESPSGQMVGDWVGSMRARLDIRDEAATPDRPAGGVVRLLEDPVWKLGAEAAQDVPRLVRFGDPWPAALPGKMVLIDPNDELTCLDAGTGQVRWKTGLRVPGVFNEFSAGRFRPEDDTPRFAATDGQTGVFAGRNAVFAVELATGRRLWAQPIEPLSPKDETETPSQDLRISAAGGLAAMTRRPSRLTLTRLTDGETIWERDLLGERIAALQMVGRRIITVDDQLERVHIFERDHGRLIGRILFEQPDPAGHLVQLVVTGNVLCGPVTGKNSEGVLAVDVETGRERWRMEVEKPIVELFEPKPGYVGIGLLGGDVRIVEADTGEIALERRVAGAQGVVRGVMLDGTLVVQHFNDRSGVRASSLSALDVATDRELWNRDDITPLWLTEDQLRRTGGWMPAILLDESQEQAEQQVRPQVQGRRIARSVRVTIVDLRTGNAQGKDVALSSTEQLGQHNGDFVVFPEAGVLIISAQRTIHALRLEGVGKGGGGDL